MEEPVRDEDVQTAVAVVIGDRHRVAVAVGGAGERRAVLAGEATAGLDEKEVGVVRVIRRVIAARPLDHEQIQVAVVLDVEPRRHAALSERDAAERLQRALDVVEHQRTRVRHQVQVGPSIAVVVAPCAGVPLARRDVRERDSLETTAHVLVRPRRQADRLHHDQIEVAVAIPVGPRRRDRRKGLLDSHRNLRETSCRRCGA